jgi:uncharacterized LabA/DUF88 family protein
MDNDFLSLNRLLNLKPNEKTVGFIDGSNLYAASRSLGFSIDYKRLLDIFNDNTSLIRMYYYTAMSDGRDDDVPIRPLFDWLDYNGYTMITKATREFTDHLGRRRIKGNMDIELATDMLLMAILARIDHAVLFSGDGDFRRVVEVVQQQGVRVTVISTMRPPSPMISDDLRRQADRFVELFDLVPFIERVVDNNIIG